jgi:hypothetical protein
MLRNIRIIPLLLIAAIGTGVQPIAAAEPPVHGTAAAP